MRNPIHWSSESKSRLKCHDIDSQFRNSRDLRADTGRGVTSDIVAWLESATSILGHTVQVVTLMRTSAQSSRLTNFGEPATSRNRLLWSYPGVFGFVHLHAQVDIEIPKGCLRSDSEETTIVLSQKEVDFQLLWRAPCL